ncbi:hypothetical protein HFO49_33535 [Rhizobium leguminosarum]|uniref:hypothetical protein n=1 Tax=Rhizobium TaxID=379 RepID=UPI0013E00E88|nr:MULTISPECIES: hypothetical protein [Rhizobium]MBY5592285.1 hypothetical protein [Rhizobium leguminosarum]MBY5606120.1 hypothetical protein [Rhizobium leguminosarum]NEJ96249.1 hypothetical protein [Rhizobium ruizarguesonis]WSH72192.1 hypothetical protein U8Q02_01245 [Rhizobium leguminosarum]
MQTVFVVRQIVARSFYLLPFLLALLTIPAPFKVLAVCLLIIKIKMTDETERFEVMHLLSYIASNMKTQDEPTANKWFGSIKKAFLLDEGIDASEVELGPLKIKVDLAFNVLEMLLAVVFIFVSLWMALR